MFLAFKSHDARSQSIGSSTATDYDLTRDLNGRILSITDSAVSGNNRAFTYDGQSRLATASGPWVFPI